jgi:hypothetical protein
MLRQLPDSTFARHCLLHRWWIRFNVAAAAGAVLIIIAATVAGRFDPGKLSVSADSSPDVIDEFYLVRRHVLAVFTCSVATLQDLFGASGVI